MVAILFTILILNMSKVKGGQFAIRGQLMISCYLIYIYLSLYSCLALIYVRTHIPIAFEAFYFNRTERVQIFGPGPEIRPDLEVGPVTPLPQSHVSTTIYY